MPPSNLSSYTRKYEKREGFNNEKMDDEYVDND